MTSILLAGTIGSQLDAIFADFDYAVFSFMGSIQDQFLTLVAKCLTALGSTIFVSLIAVVGLVFLIFKRTRKVGLALVIAIVIGTLITNIIVKPMFLRVRPYNTLQSDLQYWSWYVGAGMLSESDYCFPSGHTTGATEIAMVLLLCHATSKRKGAKAFCWIFPLAAIGVGASRIYLMVHYATDVLAGFIVGIIAGVVGFLLSSLILKGWSSNEDIQVLMKTNVRPAGILAIILAFCLIYSFSLIHVFKSGGADALRCAYDIEYACQNEAATGHKYPPINGEYYCKLHWSEMYALDNIGK
ncbi:MAG: phosphatase PAP2 family protein [Lachnospiraceae bacterium]|nr:phosphatase PAP2 family protein [Lachnospiraceae bacterium]